MKLTTLFTFGLYSAATIVNTAPSYHNSNFNISSYNISSYNASSYNNSETAARYQIGRWRDQYSSYIEATVKTRKSGCTSENIVYRREWGSLSKKTRKEYLAAVQCLQKKLPFTPRGVFFHFHRYFLWLYEQALRNECGYTGTQPYWDWTIDYKDPRKSSVFDGSPYSMGSDGLSIPHGIVNISAFGLTVPINPGNGGGCTYSGPFKNHTITLGPVASAPRGPNGGLGDNPRCLARDLHSEWTNYTKPSDVVHLFNTCNDLECFDTDVEGPVGLHTAGHFAVGGIMMDPWASSQDPVFFLHHAGVDRMWSLWQGLDPENRLDQVYGTQTAFNNPPSPNVTLNTELDYERLAPKQRLGDLISTVDGPFCYAYI